jgi:hypothetical protein
VFRGVIRGDHGHGDRPCAELHQLVVRGVIFLDILGLERVTFA